MEEGQLNLQEKIMLLKTWISYLELSDPGVMSIIAYRLILGDSAPINI
jgi:hypothetical protein